MGTRLLPLSDDSNFSESLRTTTEIIVRLHFDQDYLIMHIFLPLPYLFVNLKLKLYTPKMAEDELKC
jgi:hypothetical protein